MDIYWLVSLFVLGACVGSFLNVVIYRLPRGQSIVFPGSRCPSCGRAIRWYDNIPIVSWLALRARCRDCKAPIAPRYILIELATAVLVSGLYACLFLLRIRDGAGEFTDAWPMFLAQAALLCGLLVCAIVDIEIWIIPLEVVWVCAIVGAASAGIAPHPFMATVSPEACAMSFCAAVGIAISVVLIKVGLLQPSFIDLDPSPGPAPDKARAPGASPDKPRKHIAATADDGVAPRREVLREVVFLLPAFALALGAWLVLKHVPAVGDAWRGLFDRAAHPRLAPRLEGFGSAVFGYLIGGLWVWGMRILGTLGFGKEAMGLGDVHIMAAVGAVCGWIVPSVAFFLAPFFGLAWAVYLWLGRNQRELPYGPWLAMASLVVMLFYDPIVGFLEQYMLGVNAMLGS